MHTKAASSTSKPRSSRTGCLLAAVAVVLSTAPVDRLAAVPLASTVAPHGSWANASQELNAALSGSSQQPCVHSQGYWAQHFHKWPVTSMVLGDSTRPAHTYTAKELLMVLKVAPRGDASLILARQLIAAKLNVAAGARPDPVSAHLAAADQLLGVFPGRLPLRLGTQTAVGAQMVAVATVLEAYNTGMVPGSCGPTNRAPVANAGSDQTLALGATVMLDGTASSDPEGAPLAFAWTFLSVPAGSAAMLVDATSPTPRFVVDVAGRYDVRLVVNDGSVDSAPDIVSISTINSAPTANAGPDQSVAVRTTVHLTGAASSDPDGDALTYEWSIVSAPDGSTASLSNPAAVLPSFVVDLPGAYDVQLTVSDGGLDSAPDVVTITTANSPPVARAGADTTAAVGERVVLNGAGSSDADGDALTYRWAFVSRPADSQAVLEHASTATPAFTLDAFGNYVVQLIVNDGTTDSEADTVVVGTRNTAPVANAGPDQTVDAGAVVTLNGSSSTDVDGQPLTWTWALLAVPGGSTAVLSDAQAVQPTFTADLPGTYIAQLVVNDGQVDSAPDTVSITSEAAPVNQPPVANAGPDQTVALGTTVTLDGTASSDADGDALTYRWSLSRPATSAAVLDDATAIRPTFVADVPGAYIAQLIVNDGTVDSAPDTASISTENVAPVAHAGSDQIVPTGTLVTLDGSASTDLDGQALTYAWSLTGTPDGSAATLSDPQAVRPTFTVDLPGTYVAQLIVNDGVVNSAPATVTITSEPPANQPPTAQAGPDQTVAVGATVTLDGTASTDPEGAGLTYQWSLSRPATSSAVLSNPASASPTFVADAAGTYVAQLIVNDGVVNSTPDTVTISTMNSRPVANAGPDRNKYRNGTILLDGGASFDADGAALTYSWTVLSNGTGAVIELRNPTSATPALYTFSDGQVVLQLIVSDGDLSSEPDTVVITAMGGVDLRPRLLESSPEQATGVRRQMLFIVENLGDVVASLVRVHVSVPAGYQLHGVSGGGTWDPGAGTVTFTNIGGSVGWVILDVTPLVTGSYEFVIDAELVGQTDIYPPDNTLRIALPPRDDAEMRIEFANSLEGTLAPGAQRWLWIRAFNDGPTAARNVSLRVPVPAGYAVTSVEDGGVFDPATRVIQWTRGTLAPGSFTVWAYLVVNPTGPTDLSVTVSADNVDPVPSNNTRAFARINRPPVANAGQARSVATDVPVALDGTATTDPDGDTLTLAWAFTLRPLNSLAALQAPDSATPSLTPDVPGPYDVQLTVSDGRGGTSVQTVRVTAEVRNRWPVIRSQAITQATAGQPYRYEVDARDPDAGDVLTFSLPTAPAGMAVDADGVIAWVPEMSQGGPQNVTVRVQDAAGAAATQSFVVQVSTPSNQAPLAADDRYEVRLGESLGVPAPGVLQNDVDATPLTATLLTPPANGTVLLGADGSFVYTPFTQQEGAIVPLRGVNLANRMPGVTVSAFSLPSEYLIDEDPYTDVVLGLSTAIHFPSDVTVTEIQTEASPIGGTSSLAVTLLDAQGTELYTSGRMALPQPNGRNRLVLPQAFSRVRRVRLDTDEGWSRLAEVRVIGTSVGLREAEVPSNLTQRLPARVRTSTTVARSPEAIIDGLDDSFWYGSWDTFVEITFPQDVHVTGLRAINATSTPGGLNSSLGFNCSGYFRLYAADGAVLFDSGLVNYPRTAELIAIAVPYEPALDLSGVRRLRYDLDSCTPTSSFTPGFSEISVFGTAEIDAPAFNLKQRLQALTGREAHSTPLVVNLTDDNDDGRIDVDDVPDIVVPVEGATAPGNQLRGEIKVVSGDDGRELVTMGGPDQVSPWAEAAAGDIDGDGIVEVVAVHADGNRLIAFEHTGAVKWQSDTNAMPSFDLGSIVYTGGVSIANLDGAGRPEIIVGASVFDADGRLLGDGRALGGTTGGTGKRSALSAVADVDLDGVPELVAGPTAYRLAGGALTRVWQRTDRGDGFVGIANFDDDPEAEIVVVADGAVYMLNHDGTDAGNWNQPGGGPVPLPTGGQGGAPLVADVDGDGRPEIGVASFHAFTLFNHDGTIRWQSAITDQSSNSTGSIAFDLDGDGAVEIIYRDERHLRVYRGSDGLVLARVPVVSSTWAETPTVADADGDGHADLVVTSDAVPGFAETDTGVLVFTDVANLWTRTRRIWNQHAYHVTNVNEDGTIPQVETPHWLLPGLNADRVNAYPPSESNDAADSFTYVASDGVLQSDPATVRILVRPNNAGPRFTSTAIASAASGVLYVYAARAVDPDAGDILTYSLPSAPAGMAIDAATGVIRWTPAAGDGGSHEVVAKVADRHGLFALQSYTLTVGAAIAVPHVVGQAQGDASTAIVSASLAVGTVVTRHSPTVAAGAVISQTPAGGTMVAAGAAVSLTVSLGPAPSGTVPDVVGLTEAAATADIVAAQFALGVVTPFYTATAPAGVVLSQTPAAGTTADLGTAIALGVSAGPPPGTLDVDGDGFTGDRGDCNDTNAAINPGAPDIPGDGIDQNCNGVDSVAGDVVPPTAELVTPADLAEVTMPTDIVGTVADANLLRYTVQLAEVDATTFTTIGSGSTAVTGGIVGRLDPTLLENGLYRVRLIAEDMNGLTAVDERVYRVTGKMKVGVFGLTFVDLRVPVQGIPITILRSYDSRVKAGRDFGIGWRLQVSAGRMAHNRPPGEGWLIQDQPFIGQSLPCLGGSLETRSHMTEVRLSDREYYTFALAVDNGNLGITGACEGVASYRYLSGTLPGATLDILDGTNVIYLRGGDDTLLDMNDWLEGTPRVYEPRRVRLTTIDGRRIELDATAGVTRIEDNNGNALSITSSGIRHTSGRSIAFTRDTRGRLTRITDPMGRTLDYEYTGEDLTTFTDQAGNITTYTYDNHHNLREMHDPLGNRAVLAEYDDSGRLIAITDARGGRTVFSHDIDGREEVAIDALGRPSRFVYDDRGNVLTREKSVTIDGTSVTARTQFQYDSDGNEVVRTDPDGTRATGAYAHGNLLEEVVDPNGLALRTAWTYDSRGEMLTQTDPAGNTMAFGYDNQGNLTALTDGGGTTTLLTYDAAGRPIEGLDAQGLRTRLTYEANGRVIREEKLTAAGSVLTRAEFSYDANGNRLTRTDWITTNGVSKSLTTRFAYDELNRLVSTTDPSGNVTRIEYNALSRESARIDALGRRTAFSYDEVGALTRTDFPDGTFETYGYDALGHRVTSTDRAGRTMTSGYDELGRQVRVTRPDGTSIHTIYSAGGRIISTIDARGNRSDYEYDAAGRRTRIVLPAVQNTGTGNAERPVIGYEYDAAGRVAATVDANGRRTAFTYDGMGRLLQRAFADGTDRENAYNALGQVVEQRDEADRLTRFGYDPLGRLTSVTDALGGLTRYAYDEAGRLTAQTDALGRTTRYTRDELGRIIERRLPGSGVETFSYDAVGNTVAKTDFAGATTHFGYDAMNRLVRKTYPDGTQVSLTYTATGQRDTIVDGRGSTTYTYDTNNLLTRVTHPGGESIQYAYDADRNLTRLETSNAAIAYARDALNRITSVSATVNGSPLGAALYGYDLTSNVIEMSRPNGVMTRMNHDVRNRLTSVAHLAGATTLASFAYTLSPTGRRTQLVESTGSVIQYGYDALDRLTSEVRQGSTAVSYEYDAVGNRTRMNRDGITTSYTYDVDDRLLTAGATTYGYDANGNLTTRTLGGVTTAYEWNSDDRLLRITGPAGPATFAYDADGNRVQRQVGAAVTNYLLDANNPTGLPQVLEEQSTSGDLQALHTFGEGLLSTTRGTTTSYVHQDALGTTRFLTNGSGSVTDQYQYDGFGALTAQSGTTPNQHFFAGEQLEPSLGFYNLRARYYDPAVGRFVSRDPIRGNVADPRSQHPYLYAHADPVNVTDPTGLFSLNEIFSALGIQDVLRAVDIGRTAAQYCTLTGKVEFAQEALFWGQFAAAGPLLAESLFGEKAFNVGAEVTVSAKRFLNVGKAPDKIVEAKFSIGGNVQAAIGLNGEFTRQDGLTLGVGVEFDARERQFSKANLCVGGFCFGLGGQGPGAGLKKSFDIFNVEKCEVEMLKGSIEVGAEVSLEGAKFQASIVLEALQSLIKLTVPLIPE